MNHSGGLALPASPLRPERGNVYQFRIAREHLSRMAARYEYELPDVSAVAGRVAVLYGVAERNNGLTAQTARALVALAGVYNVPESRAEVLACAWLAHPRHLVVPEIVKLYEGHQWAHDPPWFVEWCAALHADMSESDHELLTGFARVLAQELSAPWKRYGESIVPQLDRAA